MINHGLRVYAFVVSGGLPFDLRHERSPGFTHDGSAGTVWTAVLTEAEMKSVKSWMESQGARVGVCCTSRPTHAEDIRTSFRTEKCKACFWFDLSSRSNCGIDDWDSSVRVLSLAVNKKAVRDFDECPVDRTR